MLVTIQMAIAIVSVFASSADRAMQVVLLALVVLLVSLPCMTLLLLVSAWLAVFVKPGATGWHSQTG
jgi:threonine/homoserine/homoserine lactone efflux protein